MAHWKRGLSCFRVSLHARKRNCSSPHVDGHLLFHTALLLLLLAALLFASLALSLSGRWSPFPIQGHLWRPGSLARVFSLARTVTSGVVESTEEQQTATGFQRINMLHIDLSNPNVHLGVVQAQNRLFNAGETLSSMAGRTGAVAGVNGDFFEINGTGDALGMLEIDGRVWQSPNAFAVLGVTPSGRLTIGRESFSGSVSAGDSSYPLRSVNRYHDANADGLALFTPELGATLPLHEATLAILQPVANSSTAFTVVSVQANATSLPRLSNQEALVGNGAAGAWLSQRLQPGASITLSEHLAPESDLVQAIGGGAILIKDGAAYQDLHAPVPGEARTHDPLTAVGITKDGAHAMLIVCDGHQADPGQSRGFTHAGMAAYMLAHGAYQAMLLDSGGSSEMVARLPGQRQVSVVNSPSDGHERPVANGLFLYSTEKQPGPAASVVVNGGNPLTLFSGAPTPLAAYALDSLGNPAADPVHLSVVPANLANPSQGTITATLASGQGQLLAQAGRARIAEPLQVVDHLASLHLSPAMPDLLNGQRVQFGLQGTAPGGAPLFLPTSAARWSVDPPSLGTISTSGLFLASSQSLEPGSVTATLGGTRGSASVAVGQIARPFASLTNLQLWGVSDHYMNVFPRSVPSPGPHTVSTGSLLRATNVKHAPTNAGSMDLRYHFPPGRHVYHLDPYPNDPGAFQIPLRDGKQQPEALGIWVKSNVPSPAADAGSGALLLGIGLYEGDNTPIAFHLGNIPPGRWIFLVLPLRRELTYPLRLNYLSIVSVNPASNETGDVYLCDLQALYAPRPL